MSDDSRSAVTQGLTDQSNIRQLSSSGKAAKDKRAELKKAREERERKEKEAKEAKEAEEAEAVEEDSGEAAEWSQTRSFLSSNVVFLNNVWVK